MKLRIIGYSLCVLVLTSCFGKKNVVTNKKNKGVVLEEPKPVKLPSVDETKHIKKLEKKSDKLNKKTLNYIKKYAAIAVNEMHIHKIPASITLAQGILESGNGNGPLAKKSNNHFGIKCHAQWQGERVYHDDDEDQECFRKYQYVETSYNDHSEFLTKRRRYAFLFNYKLKDYKRWAKGLKKAGYATDKQYPKKLIGIIERYKLYEFDKIKKRDFKIAKRLAKDRKSNKADEQYYKVKKGDTLYSIAKKFGTSVTELKELNALESNIIAIGQNLIVQKVSY